MPNMAFSYSLGNCVVTQWAVAALSLMLVSGTLLVQSQLPIGRRISAVSVSTDIGSLAVNIITSPDGTYAIASDLGFRL